MTTATVLCGIDGSPESHAAARVAGRLAARLHSGLVLAHVAPHPQVVARPYATRAERAWEEAVFERAGYERRLLSPVDPGGSAHVERVVEFGNPAAVIRMLAKRRASALIVIGVHSRGVIADALLGEVTRILAKGAPAPVVAVSERMAAGAAALRQHESRGIVCGIDGSAHAAAAARAAAILTHHLEEPLVLAEAPDNAYVADRLVELGRVRAAGMLAVGSRGLGPLKALVLGSVSRDLIQKADRPVMVVSPEAAARMDAWTGAAPARTALSRERVRTVL